MSLHNDDNNNSQCFTKRNADCHVIDKGDNDVDAGRRHENEHAWMGCGASDKGDECLEVSQSVSKLAPLSEILLRVSSNESVPDWNRTKSPHR